MTDPRTIRVDEFLPHPPSRVWRALTTPELLAKWLGPTDFRLRVGHRFALDMGRFGVTECEVLDFEVERTLRISWVNSTLNTTVTWDLVPEGRGTRLFTTHDGFDPDDPAHQRARRGMGGGWRSTVIRRLRECVAETAAG